jgi:hypothetical protein
VLGVTVIRVLQADGLTPPELTVIVFTGSIATVLPFAGTNIGVPKMPTALTGKLLARRHERTLIVQLQAADPGGGAGATTH